jgi:hypothetical protein
MYNQINQTITGIKTMRPDAAGNEEFILWLR